MWLFGAPLLVLWQSLLELCLFACTGHLIMRISQVVIMVFGCFMGVMAIILLEINISLGCGFASWPACICNPCSFPQRGAL